MLKLLRNFKIKEWFLVLITFGLIYGQVWFELKMPDYMQEITVLVQTSGSEMSEILKNGGYMLICAFSSLFLTVLVGFIVAYLSSTFSYRTRRQIFEHTEKFSLEEIKKFKTSSLITRTTNDITQLEMFIGMGLQLLIKSPMTAVLAVVKILNKNLTWSMVTLGAVLILLTTIGILTAIVVPKFKIVQKLTDNVNGLIRENLTGIRVVRAFNAEKYQEDKFKETNNKLTNQQLFNQKAFAVMSPVMYMVMYTLTLLIYFIGASLIKDAALTDKLTIFGDMVVFSSYAMQVIMSFLMLAFVFMILPRAEISAKRINEVLNTKISITSGDVTKGISRGVVEFKNVSFMYPDAEEYILKDITFTANKGETVAFIGSTGSGKSTLINLIPRFYDVTDGEILVDGVNVKDYKLEKLYNKIGYISQKAVLFDGTVKSNVNFGKSNHKITNDDVKEAIKLAEAEEFVLKMDDNYNEHIASLGSNLSGGQKQRLSIARALAKKAEIYIFDDSFSALDYKTDSKLRKNLKKNMKDSTILIVAQRIGTIMNADKILVLDNGKCVGMGTHKELLKNCEVYKEIAYSQLSKEELENE